MNWLARLKKIDTVPQQKATEPTKFAYVGFVAPDMAPMQKTKGDLQAANDPAPAASAAPADPDRWCWPHSTAMNTGEIDTFTARLARFTDKGLSLDDSEALADKLVLRDRESDDRRLCLECAHLAGREGTWSCKNWRLAGVANTMRDARLSAALIMQLQRCDGFTQH